MSVTIRELGERFMADELDGPAPSERQTYPSMLRVLNEVAGDLPANEFTPRHVKLVRQAMIDRGWLRSSINRQLVRLRTLLKWGVGDGLVEPSVFHAARAVRGVQRGRTEAREGEPVKPVPENHIAALKPHLSAQVWALVQLQLWTGARPGELFPIRKCDLDTSRSVWRYELADHKTAHHGKSRTIFIGPTAQGVLLPFLDRPDHWPLLRPAEAYAQQLRIRRQSRTTPIRKSNHNGDPIWRQRLPVTRACRETYSTNGYRQAVQRGCRQAGVPQWTPYQLRHNAATRLRREFGIETARVILGHATAFTTEVYAEVDVAKAEAAMAEAG